MRNQNAEVLHSLLIFLIRFMKSYPLHLPSLPGFSQYGAYGEDKVYTQDQVSSAQHSLKYRFP